MTLNHPKGCLKTTPMMRDHCRFYRSPDRLSYGTSLSPTCGFIEVLNVPPNLQGKKMIWINLQSNTHWWQGGTFFWKAVLGSCTPREVVSLHIHQNICKLRFPFHRFEWKPDLLFLAMNLEFTLTFLHATGSQSSLQGFCKQNLISQMQPGSLMHLKELVFFLWCWWWGRQKRPAHTLEA